MDVTGERFIPGADTGLLELEHVERYLFASGFSQGKSVLDIACGAGYGSSLLIEAGATRVTGVDISTEAVEFATNNYGRKNLQFIVYDAELYNHDHYDVVVSFETLEHLENRQIFLMNLLAMLNESGTLIISTPNKTITSPMKSESQIRNKYHKHEYREQEFVSALRSAGFNAIKKYGQHSYPRIFNLQFPAACCGVTLCAKLGA